MVGACTEMRNTSNIFVRKPVGKTPLGRHRRRLEDNIKMDLTKQSERVWTGLISLITEISGGLL
jgi:hypothetical protein